MRSRSAWPVVAGGLMWVSKSRSRVWNPTSSTRNRQRGGVGAGRPTSNRRVASDRYTSPPSIDKDPAPDKGKGSAFRRANRSGKIVHSTLGAGAPLGSPGRHEHPGNRCGISSTLCAVHIHGQSSSGGLGGLLPSQVLWGSSSSRNVL